MPQAAFQPMQEVLGALARYGHGEGVIRKGQAGNQHGAGYLLPGIPVDVAERFAGKVDEELLPRTVFQYHRGVLRGQPLAKVEAELRVTVTVGTSGDVFLPQQLAGDARTLKFLFVVGQLGN